MVHPTPHQRTAFNGSPQLLEHFRPLISFSPLLQQFKNWRSRITPFASAPTLFVPWSDLNVENLIKNSNLIQGYCGVGFTVCTGVPTGTPVFSMGPATSAGQSDVDATCKEDWILIPCATDQQSTSIMQSDGKTACVSKICGFFFDSVAAGKANIPVYSKLVSMTWNCNFRKFTFLVAGYRKPFEVRVYTDISDADKTYSGGFCLSYTQQPCVSSSG